MPEPSPDHNPDFGPAAVAQGVDGLLHPGAISDHDLERRCLRLAEQYRSYGDHYPHGLWTPGLVLTDEMRLVTETYLPYDVIRASLERLLRRAFRIPPVLPVSLLRGNDTWLDLLQKLAPRVPNPNPAALLQRLMSDDGYRQAFIFALFIPSHYGGSFGRYPHQAAFLQQWLARRLSRGCEGLRCLDAACGCGEGTYDLAAALLSGGLEPRYFTVTGTTLEPCELFAARHGWFPHDPVRQERFRAGAAPVAAACGSRMEFRLADVAAAPDGQERYHIILCNGLLGGPFLHDRTALAGVVARLAAQLAPGGLFMAADRFHGGWKRKLPQRVLEETLRQAGLRIEDMEEGVAATAPQ